MIWKYPLFFSVPVIRNIVYSSISKEFLQTCFNKMLFISLCLYYYAWEVSDLCFISWLSVGVPSAVSHCKQRSFIHLQGRRALLCINNIHTIVYIVHNRVRCICWMLIMADCTVQRFCIQICFSLDIHNWKLLKWFKMIMGVNLFARHE